MSQSLSNFGGSVHRFVRNSNYVSSNINRVANRFQLIKNYHYLINNNFFFKNRFKPYENTLTVLRDPKQGKKLFLIGTTNSSTLLSYRTQKLILNERPDTVYVQTNQQWYFYI